MNVKTIKKAVSIFLMVATFFTLSPAITHAKDFSGLSSNELQNTINVYEKRINILKVKNEQKQYARYRSSVIIPLIRYLEEQKKLLLIEQESRENQNPPVNPEPSEPNPPINPEPSEPNPPVNPEPSEPIRVIKFGRNSSTNIFGNLNWKNLSLGNSVSYNNNNNPGIVFPEPKNNENWVTIRGEERKFTVNDRIEFIWKNTSDSSLYLKTLVSFTDVNGPYTSPTHQWYTAGMKGRAPAGATFSTFYDIHGDYPGKTSTQWGNSEGNHSQISIYAEPSQNNAAVLQEIRIVNSDITPPNSPQNLQLLRTTDFSVELTWNSVEDAKLYYIYRNNRQVGVSITNTFTDYYLKSDTPYTYYVTALDEIDFGTWKKHNESNKSNQISATTQVFNQPQNVINPHTDLEYKGAFRLPEASGNSDWNYSGEGLTFNSNGDALNNDSYPGSLIGFGHVHNLPSISEINIPTPVISKNLSELPTATTLQPFTSLKESRNNNSLFPSPFQLPVGDLAIIDNMLYYSLASYYYFGPKFPSLGRVLTTDFSAMSPLAFIGKKNEGPFGNQQGMILIKVPENWRNLHAPGMELLTAMYRSGGLGGLGMSATLFNSKHEQQTLSQNDELDAIQVLQYGPYKALYEYKNSVNGFHESSRYAGGEWIDYKGKEALMFSGKKSLGRKYYGYVDGTVYGRVLHDTPQTYDGNATGVHSKGIYEENFEGIIIFYNPDDIAKVVRGELQPHQIHPYASFTPDTYAISPQNTHERVKWSAMAFDEENGNIYILEKFGDGSKPVVHVWTVQGSQ